jgi:hypothetical protein
MKRRDFLATGLIVAAAVVVDGRRGICSVTILARIIHGRQRPKGESFREKAMGLWLEADF